MTKKLTENKCQKCQDDYVGLGFKLCPSCWLENGKSHELKLMKSNEKNPKK